MSLGTDGIVGQWQNDLGAEKVGVMKMPKFANSQLAQGFNATQSISYFICKWSKNKQEAADFLRFMHTPERIKRWYELTGVGVADKRFDAAAIQDPVLKQMYEWETTGTQVWLENYNPVQVDSEANIPAGQLIFSQSGSPKEASQLWVQVARRWQTQQPEQSQDWKSWKPAEPTGV
jgi:raffinose/stachyose/melibiose transport system substrate-binding protein